MSESVQDRVARLRAWLVDLELLVIEAQRAKDSAAVEAAEIMRSECQRFIAEAEGQIGD